MNQDIQENEKTDQHNGQSTSAKEIIEDETGRFIQLTDQETDELFAKFQHQLPIESPSSSGKVIKNTLSEKTGINIDDQIIPDSKNTLTIVDRASVRPNVCDVCRKSFILKHHLVAHYRSHSGVRPHTCTFCGKGFLHKHSLITHMSLHSAERSFECQVCKKRFSLKHHLQSHMKIHSVKISSNLIQHEDDNNDSKRTLENNNDELMIQDASTSESTLSDEIEVGNSYELPPTQQQQNQNQTPPIRLFGCQCGWCFRTQEALTLHHGLHIGDKNSISDLYALMGSLSTFYQQNNRDDSIRFAYENVTPTYETDNRQNQKPEEVVSASNNQEELHQTPSTAANIAYDLLKPPKNQESLLVQETTHKRPKIKFCSYCNKGFVNSTGLLNHLKRFPEGSCVKRNYVCSECGQAFLQKNHLISHQKKHQNGKV